MGIEDHLMNDLCCAWLCAPCAIGQQGMAVDRELGYEVELCCELNWKTATENVYRDGTVSGYNQPDQGSRGYAYMNRPDAYSNMKSDFGMA